MRNTFDMDNLFFRFTSRIADIFILNLIFVITCIPVVTIGAAVTALMSTSLKMSENKEGYIVRQYWKAFRQNFKQATGIHLIMAAIGALLGFDIYFWFSHKTGMSAVMLIGAVAMMFVYLMVLLYAYVQQALFENTVKANLKNGFLTALKNFPFTVLMMVCLAVVTAAVYFLNSAKAFMLLFGFGLYGYLTAFIYRRIYREYIEDEPDEDVEE